MRLPPGRPSDFEDRRGQPAPTTTIPYGYAPDPNKKLTPLGEKWSPGLAPGAPKPPLSSHLRPNYLAERSARLEESMPSAIPPPPRTGGRPMPSGAAAESARREESMGGVGLGAMSFAGRQEGGLQGGARYRIGTAPTAAREARATRNVLGV